MILIYDVEGGMNCEYLEGNKKEILHTEQRADVFGVGGQTGSDHAGAHKNCFDLSHNIFLVSLWCAGPGQSGIAQAGHILASKK